MQVELFKKVGSYVDKDGNERKSTQFYVKAGETLVAVEPTYYHKKDENGVDVPDRNYLSRKSVLMAFAGELPDKKQV